MPNPLNRKRPGILPGRFLLVTFLVNRYNQFLIVVTIANCDI